MKRKTDRNITGSYKDDKVIISSEYFEDDRPSYICSICNKGPLVRLTDADMQNTFFCRFCSVEFYPEEENVRRESKLSVPDRNQETLVSNTPGIPDVSIRKEVELKGGFAELAKKGIKITEYKEDITKKRSWKVS